MCCGRAQTLDHLIGSQALNPPRQLLHLCAATCNCMYTYNLPFIILIIELWKSSEFKMNAILDFARFLSSGCFVGDLGLILGGLAVVVCVWGVCRWFYEGGGGFVWGGFVRGVLSGGFCLGGFVRGGEGLSGGVLCGGVLSGGVLSGGVLPGGFCPEGFSPGGFVREVLSGGFSPGGFCTGGFVRGFCPGGFVQGGFDHGGVLSIGGFVQRGIVRGVLSGGFCRGGFVLESSEHNHHIDNHFHVSQ